MKIVSKLAPLLVLFALTISCAGGEAPPVTSPTTSNPPTTPPPVSTPPVTIPPVTTPPASTPPGNVQPEATFDFDAGLPVLAPGRNTPLEQTSGGVTASFSSPADPAAFSIQTGAATFLKLSQFTANFLYDNTAARKLLYISFNQPLNGINLTFATTDSHGPGNVEEPSYVKLTAYLDSRETTPVGEATARGTFGSDSFPQGTLSFDSGGQAFNLVIIEITPQPRGGPSFLVDNIIVKTYK